MGTRQLESLRIEVTGLRGDDEQAPRILRVSYYRTVLIFRVTDQDLSSSRCQLDASTIVGASPRLPPLKIIHGYQNPPVITDSGRSMYPVPACAVGAYPPVGMEIGRARRLTVFINTAQSCNQVAGIFWTQRYGLQF